MRLKVALGGTPDLGVGGRLARRSGVFLGIRSGVFD